MVHFCLIFIGIKLNIEPWFGFPGSFNKIDDLETRDEMIHLASNQEYKNAISIEFHVED